MNQNDAAPARARGHEHLPLLVCELDAGGQLVRAGATLAAWFGPGARTGLPLASLLPGMAREDFATGLARALAAGGGPFELRLGIGDDARVAGVQVEAGAGPGGATVVFEDLTGLRLAERRARTVTAQFEQAFGASAAGLGIVAPDGRWLRANRALCEMLGYSEAELRDMRFQDVTHPDDLAADLALNERLFAGEQGSFSMHKRYLHRDGRVLHAHLAVALVRDDDGRPRHSIAQIIDMTSRVEVEAQLREHELLHRAMTESSPVGIFVDSEVGECIYVNPAYLRISGLSHDEALGTGWRRTLHPDDRARVEASIAERRATGGVGMIEHRYQHDDGVTLWARVTTVQLVDGGVPRGFLGVVEDISAARAAAEEIHTLNAELGLRVAHRTLELEAAMRDLESFAYSVSHDLKAPLRAIDGYAALLAEGAGSDAQAGQFLRAIRGTAARMAQLIEDLLALSSVGRRDLRREEVDLAVIARTVIGELAVGHPEARRWVRIAPTLPASGDVHLLHALMRNLLDNALKFSGGVEAPAVEVGSYREGGSEVYFVRDNGVGFDPAYADKLFQPFQRLHRAEDFAGSGIGLASASRVVERHGGRIWANSSPGQGASFAFTLPTGSAA